MADILANYSLDNPWSPRHHLLMHSLDDSLHLSYVPSEETLDRLAQWTEALSAEPQHEPYPWHLHLHRYLRSVTVTASTAIEGNPMSAPEVDALLQGEHVDAPATAQLENQNYNRALALATSFVLTDGFSWSEMVVRAINNEILHDLPDDRQGRYREEPVSVARAYTAPDHQMVRPLMALLMQWLNGATDEHPLVRAALLHLNLVAIHPFVDGNGRSARVLSSLELMRAGMRAPELVSVEPYLAAHRDEYFERIHTTLGDRYQPDRHSATEWVEYYVRISASRLDMDTRIDEAWPHDIGLLTDQLMRRGQPLVWGGILHMAASYPLRTREIADLYDRSLPWARSMFSQMVTGGWLVQQGRTSAARWLPSERLMAMDLRVPELIRRFEQGQTLGLEVA